LRRLDHPYITAYRDGFWDQGNYYLIVEGPTGTFVDLMQYFQAITGAVNESDVRRYLMMLSSALAHAHAHCVVHLDVKPSNVLLMRDGTLRLWNFGIARSVSDRWATADTLRGAGTPAFMAPELIGGDVFSTATDIWALGVMCYWLLTVKLPFQNPLEILTKHPDPLPDTVTPGFRQLIMRMLAREPEERSSAMEIQAGPRLGPSRVVVWRDANLIKRERHAFVRELGRVWSKEMAVITAEEDVDAGEAIDCSDHARLWVITSCSEGGAEFIAKCRKFGVTNPIFGDGGGGRCMDWTGGRGGRSMQ
jgi:serine/threonine protein kinase